MSIRVCVTGGRDYPNQYRVYEVLSQVHTERNIACLMEGGARGADMFARAWAKSVGLKPLTFDAEWEKYKRPRGRNPAGQIRNQRMLDEGKPDLVIAFPGGNGTAGMVKIAKKAGLDVMEISDP